MILVKWDFGDGSQSITVETEKVTKQEQTKGKFTEARHSFAKAGQYIVKAENINGAGIKAITHLHVVVED